MDQENRPRFSRITVGQTEADDALRLEDEETITIGATDVEATLPQTARREALDPAQAAAAKQQLDVSTPADESIDRASVNQASGDSNFGPPMPLVQKLVIAVCGVALIVTLVFLTRFWILA
jgi:hypothetical protein